MRTASWAAGLRRPTASWAAGLRRPTASWAAGLRRPTARSGAGTRADGAIAATALGGIEPLVRLGDEALGGRILATDERRRAHADGDQDPRSVGLDASQPG